MSAEMRRINNCFDDIVNLELENLFFSWSLFNKVLEKHTPPLSHNSFQDPSWSQISSSLLYLFNMHVCTCEMVARDMLKWPLSGGNTWKESVMLSKGSHLRKNKEEVIVPEHFFYKTHIAVLSCQYDFKVLWCGLFTGGRIYLQIISHP